MRCLVVVTKRWGPSPAHATWAPTAQSPAFVQASVVTVRGWEGLVSPWEPRTTEEEEGIGRTVELMVRKVQLRRTSIGMQAVCSRKNHLQKSRTFVESDCPMIAFSLEHPTHVTMYLVAQIRPWAASHVVVTSVSTVPTTVSALTAAASAGILTTTTGIKGGGSKIGWLYRPWKLYANASDFEHKGHSQKKEKTLVL